MQEEQKRYISLKPYTLKDLSGVYGVDPKTLKKWIEPFAAEIGERQGYYFTIAQVRKIFKLLELPSYARLKEETDL